jgi:hypothetical protein
MNLGDPEHESGALLLRQPARYLQQIWQKKITIGAQDSRPQRTITELDKIFNLQQNLQISAMT